MTIGLITDFGDNDYFVGTLKGVIKKIAPQADIIDICHAAFVFYPGRLLRAGKDLPFFPAGTIFLAVVDPGVGTRRKLLLVSGEGYRFVAPDNGTRPRSLIWAKNVVVRELDKERFFLFSGSSTFEARDRMAPVAASSFHGNGRRRHRQRRRSEYGGQLGSTNRSCLPPDLHRGTDHLGGQVRQHDHQRPGEMALREALGQAATSISRCASTTVEIDEYRQDYASASGLPFLLVGSHGSLEIAMNRRHAFRELKASLYQKFTILF